MDFPHTYTNIVSLDGDTVVKRFVGPGAHERCGAETTALRTLWGRLAVPELLSSNVASIRTRFVNGVHAKDLLDGGHASEVMKVCGRILRTIQDIPVAVMTDGTLADVVVHGDFGPNNILLERDTLEVIAVIDWEWCHPGSPIEDAAWCEWIVRTFHPEQVDHLDEFFAAYGSLPAWSDRQDSMLDKLDRLLSFALERSSTGEAVDTRSHQMAVTEAWSE